MKKVPRKQITQIRLCMRAITWRLERMALENSDTLGKYGDSMEITHYAKTLLDAAIKMEKNTFSYLKAKK